MRYKHKTKPDPESMWLHAAMSRKRSGKFYKYDNGVNVKALGRGREKYSYICVRELRLH